MARLSRVSAAFPLAAATLCLLVLVAQASEYTSIVEYTELNGYTFDLSGWQEGDGTTTKVIQHSTLTAGEMTIKGRDTPFQNSPSVGEAKVTMDNITIKNGYVTISQYFPVGSGILLSRFKGTVAANTPLFDATTMSFASVTVVVKNSDIAWAATETTTNTQVLFLAPLSLRSTSSLFVLNNLVKTASSVVSITNAESLYGLSLATQSLIAIDYTSCTGCTNGLLYSRHSDMTLTDYSMLRVSHSSISNVGSGKAALLNAGSTNGIVVDDYSLLVVENVSASSNNIFSATKVTTSRISSVVLRYVTARAVGATLDGGASYKLLSVSNSNAALSAAVSIKLNQCAAACMPDATVDSTCACVCPVTATGTRSPNFCTFVEDAMLTQYPQACATGCASCTSSKSCSVCAEGYTQASNVCYQKPVACGANCAQCTSSGVCQQCATGYAMTSSKACAACTVSNCATCPSSVSTCATCDTDYLLLNGICEKSCLLSNCRACIPSSNTQCSTCSDGYVLSQDRSCTKRGDSVSGLVTVAHSISVLVALLLTVFSVLLP